MGLDLPADERQKSFDGILDDPQEIADINEFAVAAPRVSIAETKVFVEGEDGVFQGDLATMQVTLSRANVQEGEAIGSAHTPLFPTATVPEAWWILFTLPGKNARTGCIRMTTPLANSSPVDMKFKVSMLGKCRCKVRVVSEVYIGLDLEETVSFEAKPPTDDAEDDEPDQEDDDDSEDD